MIYKSFLRKKITYLYLIILTILTTTIIILNNFSSKLIDEQNNIYEQNAYLIITGSNSYIKKLKNNKYVSKIDKLLLFSPNYEKNTIIEEKQSENKIVWNWLFNYDYSSNIILVNYSDKLKDNSVSLGLDTNIYNKLIKEKFYLNQDVVFNFNNKEIKLKVKNIYDSNNNPIITISKDLFDKLYQEEANKTISVVVARESKANEIISNIRKDKNCKVTRIWSVKEEDERINTRLKETLNILSISNYIVIIILTILLIIINKNIIEDYQNNFVLEKKLGFNNGNIRFNAFKRILLLYILCLCLSLIISFVITTIVGLEFKLNITIITILFIMFIIDLLLCLFFKINSTFK